MQKIFDDFLKEIKKNDMVINYVQIYKDGEQVIDYSRLPSKTRLHAWSLSKSVISVAVGIAMDEGFLNIDEKICDSFPDYVQENSCENLTNLTVRHLLTMTTGFDHALFFADDPERYITKDWIGYFFKQEFPYKPGERFLYCNFNSYMLGCLIERKTGRDLMDYLNEKLFLPLEIYSPDWTRCPMGHVHGANGLYLTIDEYARFGIMLLNKGTFKGKRIVSESYLEEATKNQVENNPPGYGYGYQFWINPDGSFRADGKFGQYIIIMPEKNTMVVTMALEGGGLFDVVWEEICEKIMVSHVSKSS